MVMTKERRSARTVARTEPARPAYGGGHNTYTQPQSHRTQSQRGQLQRTQIDPRVVGWYNSLDARRQVRKAQTASFLRGLARAEAAERQATILPFPTTWPLLLKGSQ
jgi:hypothetical protein